MQDFFQDDDAGTRMSELGKRIRKSEMYPAILGAIAGGIAGAVIALLIAGNRRPRTAASNATEAIAKPARASWSPREIIELITLGAALGKQVRAWWQARDKH